MTKYLISFRAGAMDHIRVHEMPAVAKAAHEVCQEAIHAGVLVLAGGLTDQPSSIVSPDGTVTAGPNPAAFSGITVIEVPTREEALAWASRVAAACRCAQEVLEIGADPELDAMLLGSAS